MAVLGLINVDLMAEAKWRGFVYVIAQDSLPVLGLLFDNVLAGQQVFRGWRKRLGDVDAEDRLVLGAMTGIERLHPDRYRAVIVERIDTRDADDGRGPIVIMPCVRQTLHPTSSSRDLFLESLAKHGRYRVAPLKATAVADEVPREVGAVVDLELAIEKQHFAVVAAWQVGKGHPLAMGFMRGDKPLIPADVGKPPCKEVLDFIANPGKGVPWA